jgi:LmbE family N-acetylglucosaminyl deacetylase
MDQGDAVQDKKILVVVAHPDDAESFCGGTLARLTCLGNHVTLVICTNGDRGSHDRRIGPTDLTRMRREEQNAAQKMLGIEEVIWFGYRDGELAHMTDLRERLIRVIRQSRPDILMTFDPWKHYEFHPDHRAVGFLATEARMLADLPWICPEFTMEGLNPWHPSEVYLFAPQEPNYSVDITDTIELKVSSRLAHRSQNDFIHSDQDTLRFVEEIKQGAAAAGAFSQCAYAELFHKVDGTDLWI